jgi:hypothetical protein
MSPTRTRLAFREELATPMHAQADRKRQAGPGAFVAPLSLRLPGTRGGAAAIVSRGDGGRIRLGAPVAEGLAAKGFFVVIGTFSPKATHSLHPETYGTQAAASRPPSDWSAGRQSST